ncbi:hypothetical protein L2E82_49398 [Cichorium intybus]|uniref:Uncharacterized protein n=1 Tax=Cichorium intybus TaxID=13427 RepID=A0ACB8Z1T0_CICIN|nr:hypothetical protein L2E82_49398 [Cichorium intybus]
MVPSQSEDDMSPMADTRIGSQKVKDAVDLASHEPPRDYAKLLSGTRMEDVSPPRKLAAIMTDGDIPTPTIPNLKHGPMSTIPITFDPNPNPFGDLNGLLLGGFGPFPSPAQFTEKLNPTSPSPFGVKESLGKRKRHITGGPNFPINFISQMSSLAEHDSSPVVVLPNSKNKENATVVNNISNTGDTQAPAPNPEFVVNIPPTEAEAIAEIGRKLGFDIGNEDPILKEVLGDGEIRVSQ